MDFFIGLLKCEGKSIIMVVVDRFTKYVCFCALYFPSKVSAVATMFMETIQKIHENPNIYVNDREPTFNKKKIQRNNFLILILNLAHVKHVLIIEHPTHFFN